MCERSFCLKVKLSLLIIAIALLFSGCSVTQTSIEALISPPKLSEEQLEIDAALKNKVGSNINLIYPEKGNYTSAFVVENFDSEPSSEALVFYKEASAVSTNSSASIRINVLDQQNGEWVSVYDETTINANEVEKLNFIEQDGKEYIVIGFNTASATEKTVYVYEYYNSTLNAIYSTNCVDYEVYDIDNDTLREVILIANTVVTETQIETVAKMLEIENSTVTEVSQTTMDDTNPRYVNIYLGKLHNGTNALYFDSQSGVETYTTEIITYSFGNLVNLSLRDNKSALLASTRLAGLYCTDLNDDLVYEIPKNVLIPGYEEANIYEKIYYTNWYNYIDGLLQIQSTTYTDFSLGYSFFLPSTWVNEDGSLAKVTATKNIINSEIVFSTFDEKTRAPTTDILSIRVFIRSTLPENELPYGYSEILSNGQLVYAYKTFENAGEFSVSADDIIANFSLID